MEYKSPLQITWAEVALASRELRSDVAYDDSETTGR